MEQIKSVLMKIMSIVFSIFFAIILFNIIFFNCTDAIKYNVLTMIIGTIAFFIAIKILQMINKKKKLKFLEYNPKKVEILCVMLIIFFIQYILASLTYSSIGWDVGTVMDKVLALLQNQSTDMIYFAIYTNNIGILLMMTYVIKIVQLFTEISTSSDIFFVAIVVNIIAIDIAAIFTFFTIKKVLGNKSSYFSLIFIIPLMIFSPYIIIPYTDTLTMVFPIAIFYFYIKIKEQVGNNVKKYLFILLEGILLAFGMTLKPTVIIVVIAIPIMEILNIISKIENKKVLKNIKYFLVVLTIFCIGFCIIRLCFSKLKDINLSQYITEEMYYDYEFPFTHWIMMGMNNSYNGHAGYNWEDVKNTKSIIGFKEKQEYNIQVIKERLQDFGFFGYMKFLYNKVNWILADGTFFYGREGNWYSSEPYNTSVVGNFLQKFIQVDTNEFKNVTANVMQILWISIIIGLIFSIVKKDNNDDYINIGKLTIIGIILFILIFEGRSRYLINYLPIFILIGTYGLTNCLKMMKIKKSKNS